jgi:hypothetical protein
MKIIYRFSDLGYDKQKLPLVNNENCFINFCNNFLNGNFDGVTIIMDNCYEHTVEKFKTIINKMSRGGTPKIITTLNGNAGSYKYALQYAMENFSDDEIVYFVEGDYIHDIDSKKILEEGYNLMGAEVDYVTLYAHPDKEATPDRIIPEYVFRSINSYWRTCEATTMTHAAKVQTIKRDFSIINKWVSGKHPDDYRMFLELKANGKLLVSSMPGYSTHGETAWLSPFKDWNHILEKSLV